MERSDGPVDEAARRAFERDRLEGGARPLDEFLPPTDDPAYPATLEELVCIDLEMRFRAWSSAGRSAPPPDASAYRERFPVLAEPAPAERIAEEAEWLRKRHAALLDAGSRVGRYELIAPLGRGAFAVVWRARDAALGRDVALKAPRPDLVDDVNVSRRLLREAQSAARLHHPGIVPVHEVGEHDGRPFVVSELIEGETLARRLTRGPFSPDAAAGLAAALADALEYAHSCGVVHRDVKPGNVLLGDEGRPLLADFGLARLGGAESSLTREGDLLGTPAYMAPEQARGDTAAVGPPADVYAVGAILYEMLTGRPPFEGRSAASVLYSVLHEDPAAPRAIESTIPRDLDTICGKALAKEPARRYGSAAALADDLRRFVARQPIRARRMGPIERLTLWARRNRALAATLAGALVVVAVVTVLAFGRVSDERDRFRAQRDESNANLFRALVGEAEALSIAHEGPWLSAARDKLAAAAALPEVARDDVALRAAATHLETRPWPSIEPVARWETAAPVRRVAVAGGTLVVLRTDEWLELRDPDTGEVIVSVPPDEGAGPGPLAVSGDGFAVMEQGGSVRVWNAAERHWFARFPADGEVTALGYRHASGHVAVGCADGTVELRALGPSPTSLWRVNAHAGAVTALAFTADGEAVLSGGEDGMLRRLVVEDGRVGDEQRVRDPPRLLHVSGPAHVELATNEQLGFAEADPRWLQSLRRRDGVERDAVVAVQRADDLVIATVAADGALSAYHGDTRLTRSRSTAAQVRTAWIDRERQRIYIAPRDGGIEVHAIRRPRAVRRVVGAHRARFLPGTELLASPDGVADANAPEARIDALRGTDVVGLARLGHEMLCLRDDGKLLTVDPLGLVRDAGAARLLASGVDGARAVAANHDHALRLLSQREGDFELSARTLGVEAADRVRTVAFVDRARIVTLLADEIRVAGLASSSTVVRSLAAGPRAPLLAVAAGWVYVPAPNGGLEMSRLGSAEGPFTLGAEHGTVSALRARSDSEHVFVATRDAVRAYAVGSDLETARYDVPGVRALAYAPSEQLLFLGNAGGASLWDTASRTALAQVSGTHWLAAAFGNDGALFAAREGGGVWRFDVERLRELRDAGRRARAKGEAVAFDALVPDEAVLPAAPRRLAWGFDVSADGRRMATSDHEGALTIWDAGERTPLRTVSLGPNICWDVSLSAAGTRAVCGHGDEVVLVDAGTGDVLARMTHHEKMVTAVEMVPDGPVISASHDGSVVALDPATLSLRRALHVDEGSVLSLDAHPDRQRIAAGTHTGRVLVMRVDGDDSPQVAFDTGDDSVWAVTWSADGTRLAAATRRGRVLVLADGTWVVEHDLSLALRMPRDLTFDDTGRWLGIPCYYAPAQLLDLHALDAPRR